MLLTGVAISFFVAFALLPVIIRVFKSINLLDSPDRRKVHKMSKPSLGGIAIYAGVILAMTFTIPLEYLAEYKFLVAGMVISILLGMRDDVSSLYANQKLVFQVLAGFITVYYAGIKLAGLYGVFGINDFPDWLAITFSVFVMISLSNSFNLIDGIDGLAASLAILVSTVFAVWFYINGDTFFAMLSMMLISALIAFLIFNWYPSRIFMGDTGSLVTGFLLSALAIRFIDTNASLSEVATYRFDAFVAVAISLVIVPVYDTIRVMAIRIYEGRSPFFPDKKHIHHILLRQGFNHAQATLILVAFTFFVFLIVSQLQFLGDTILIISSFTISFCFGLFWDLRLKRHLQKERERASKNREMFISKSA
jgi:UDP-GlcNAc:undecaprenyl-phosphate GlcNAc-1-phosphate transferase